MRIHRELEPLSAARVPMAVAIGTFDGVHRGHQAVLRAALQKASAMGGEAWGLTFDPHPLKVLHPHRAPPLLTSTPHKLMLLEALGMAGCVVLAFTPALAVREPEAFLEQTVRAWPAARTLVVGANWTFGRGGRGDVTLLRQWAQRSGVAVEVVPPVEWEGQPISSTRIRRAIQKGRLDEASAMLGRSYSLRGTVMAGRRVGTGLGFPTANLDPHNEALPPPGVYAVRAMLREGAWNGAAFLDDRTHEGLPAGFRPVEVHLLDYHGGELYGRDMEVVIRSRLRGVQRFDSPEALRAQIARDVEAVRAGSAADRHPNS